MQTIELLHKALELFGPHQTSMELGVTDKTLRNWIDDGEIARRASVHEALSLMIQKVRHPTRDLSADFSFIDLFAGIGGIRRGFEANGGQCVFTSEWDKYSQKAYRANFCDSHPVVGDITKVETSIIPDHDLLLAGFPCQPFSLAGVSKKNSMARSHGFACNTQGTLFFDVERIIDEKRPTAFLLENVKNLQSHDNGRTFAVIRDTLEVKLGYQIFFKIIDANGFVPQHRQRIFIVGFSGETDFSWDAANIPEKRSTLLLDILHPEDGSEAPEPPYTMGSKGTVSEDFILSDKLWNYLQEYKRKHEAKGNGFGFGLVGPLDTARTLSARYHKDGSEILVARGPGKNPRRLTPRECARLMGYPDSAKIPVSNTQAYRQFGNSVVVPVIKEIARLMKPHMMALKNKTSQRELDLVV